MLTNELICWLLEPNDPSVRYFTLRELQDRPESDEKIRDAKAAIMTSAAVVTILASQLPSGAWEEPERYYRNKFTGTAWNVITLAELGVDSQDPRIRNACEYLFENAQCDCGGFTALPNCDKGVIPCLTGNMARSLAVLGYLGDPRLELAFHQLIETQMRDGGWLCSQRWTYRGVNHGCFWATLKVLWAFSEVPQEELSTDMQRAIRSAAEFLLGHHLYKTNDPAFEQVSRHWFTCTFPNFYSCDLPFALRVLNRLGYGQDGRLDEAKAMITAKQDAQGRWAIERTYPGKVLFHFGRLGQPNKWVTLNALRALD